MCFIHSLIVVLLDVRRRVLFERFSLHCQYNSRAETFQKARLRASSPRQKRHTGARQWGPSPGFRAALGEESV